MSVNGKPRPVVLRGVRLVDDLGLDPEIVRQLLQQSGLHDTPLAVGMERPVAMSEAKRLPVSDAPPLGEGFLHREVVRQQRYAAICSGLCRKSKCHENCGGPQKASFHHHLSFLSLR